MCDNTERPRKCAIAKPCQCYSVQGMLSKYSCYDHVLPLFCSWLDMLFCVGLRHSLEHNDLYAHPRDSNSVYLLDKFNRFELN